MKTLSIISTLALASIAASPAIAADTEWFVGAGVGYQENKIKGDSRENGEDSTYQLRAGAIVNDNHRLMGSYGYMDKTSQDLFLASYDYLHPVAKRFHVFAGISAGVADSKINGKSSSDFTWGGQVGAKYDINDTWSTDLTYRYLDQDYDESNTQIDYSQQIVLSLDYKF
ncbi:porin family protein [Photobacterium sp. SDRW27]|uniref:outer membrane beta-barrel protein n=1 Tax=Photobacterium obscurum TaxID=2829490 RepID=UPI0022449365|nr:outer membrane beta-barrel protein [Photobacterium obscurum]MCW8330988.1 porin family protein [Photobacterium obscurum]